jgi:hypothetical protein
LEIQEQQQQQLERITVPLLDETNGNEILAKDSSTLPSQDDDSSTTHQQQQQQQQQRELTY